MLEQILALSPIVIAVVVTALLFDFVNGWNDSANAIATIVSTRVLSPLKAVVLAAVFNMAGAMAGTEVAKTIATKLIRTGPEFLHPDQIVAVVLAAMIGAVIWAAWMTLIGLPISGSHSLIGGLAGAAVAAGGVKVLVGKGITQVLIALLVSPIAGAIAAFFLICGITWIVKELRPRVIDRLFAPLQLISCSFMAFTHGLNDAQKVMGIITMALVGAGAQLPDANGEVHPLFWVKISCGIMISLGTALGGWKVIKTLGSHLSKLNTMSGFSAETGAGLVLSAAAGLGVPVSTTHTITGAIMGVGASKGLNAVRWSVGQKIILAWVLTLPTCAIISGLTYWILTSFLPL